MEVAEHSAQINADVVVITFAKPELLRGFQRKMDRRTARPIPAYGDPERTLYEAFGFDRPGFARVWLDPRVLRRYAGLLLRGRRPQASEQDTLQLGGDVVVDREGRVAWVYRSEGPEDRPTVEAIAGAVRAAG